MIQETFQLWDLVRLILEVLRYVEMIINPLYPSAVMWCLRTWLILAHVMVCLFDATPLPELMLNYNQKRPREKTSFKFGLKCHNCAWIKCSWNIFKISAILFWPLNVLKQNPRNKHLTFDFKVGNFDITQSLSIADPQSFQEYNFCWSETNWW